MELVPQLFMQVLNTQIIALAYIEVMMLLINNFSSDPNKFEDFHRIILLV
jgi:hypothetical protein